MTLPLANTMAENTSITVLDESGSPTFATTINITAHSGDSIVNGIFGTTVIIPVGYGAITVTSDGGTSWDYRATPFPPSTTVTLGTSDGVVPTQNAVKTYVDPKTTTITSNATWSPAAGVPDSIYTVTAQAAAVTTVANPTGTPVNGQRLTIRVKGDATPRAISGWGSQYRAGTTTAFPTTTIASKTSYFGFTWNSTDSKWDLRSVSEGY